MKTIAALLFFVISFAAYGQGHVADSTATGRTTLTGVVYDINGSVIVNWTKVVALAKDRKEYVTATNDEGVYNFDLPLGIYKIEVSARGFCPKLVEHFRIVNSTYGKMSLDFVLEVAESTGGNCEHKLIQQIKPKRSTKKKLEIVME
jgi:hypothetical protein